ncbi:biopolymer transport protein ExbD [Epibacterium ulvae]|uniref:Biopolymer transport protein ExbD n=1 Tax=Epibacterium ulvae TaxID=1156985 RepID=A0A1G5QUF6_9RHOB|nr:biopolymer transporter ExbD [Epibacterium ulvae]SCZ64709.1 biopolymer transport protein ExbD [Epibacterium ulvae]
MKLGLEDQPRSRRKPSLTPMIDVVFLLLVFFMLASRFGTEAVLDLPLAGNGGQYNGPPRLVTISSQGVKINNTPVSLKDLPVSLGALMQAPTDLVILRGDEGANVQQIIDVTGVLHRAGLTSFVLVE